MSFEGALALHHQAGRCRLSFTKSVILVVAIFAGPPGGPLAVYPAGAAVARHDSAASGPPVFAMIVVLRCDRGAAAAVAERLKESTVLRHQGQTFSASGLRRALATALGVSAGAFNTQYGLMLTTSSSEPRLETAATGDGYCMLVSAAGKRSGVRLCVTSEKHSWRSVFHSTLAPDDVLIARVTLGSEPCVLGLRAEPLRIDDVTMPGRYRSMQHAFAEDLKAETAGAPSGISQGTMSHEVHECIVSN